MGGGLTSTGSVRQQHVPVETVALVTPVSVHAPVFARPWLQPALVQVCGETETESGHGQTDRQKELPIGGLNKPGVKGEEVNHIKPHPSVCVCECVCRCVFGRRLGCHQGSEVLPCSDKPATSSLMV